VYSFVFVEFNISGYSVLSFGTSVEQFFHGGGGQGGWRKTMGGQPLNNSVQKNMPRSRADRLNDGILE
jgi:hypothetical protein